MPELVVRLTGVVERPQLALALDARFPVGTTCVVGASGAGKSTLLAAIAGLVTPTGGHIALGDEVWHDAARVVPAHHRAVGYLPQSLALFPHLDALGNVGYGMARALPRAERRAQAQRWLDRLGVGALAARRPRTYSGGEAQRVALARALARQPRVLLLDEPFSALHRSLRQELGELVHDLVGELGIPALHVTHHLDEAKARAVGVVQIGPELD